MKLPVNNPVLAGLVSLLVCVCNAAAERYLTAVETQRLCFPAADHFDAQTNRLAPDEVKAVEKLCPVKMASVQCRYWVARQGTNILGVLVLDQVFGKHELIDYAVAIAPDGRVLQVEILQYRETFGSEIRGTEWRGQFKGKSVTSPLKLTGDIYNISGATISCRHVTEGVKRVLATFEVAIKPRLTAPASAPPSKP